MKKVIVTILCLIAFVLFAGTTVYLLFVAPEPDYSHAAKSGVLALSFGMKLLRRKRPIRPNYRLYEKVYKDYLKGAFTGDKKNYRKLMEAIACYNRDEFKKSHKILDQLEKECKTAGDYSAVYMFRAMNYEEQGLMDETVRTYERLLQYDMTNSIAWSNLGLCYKKKGRMDEVYEAYTNAIRYDPNNESAYMNLSCYYLAVGDASKALENALKSIEIQPDFVSGLEAAAVSSKLLGNEEAVREYCIRHAAAGGDETKLREALAKL